MFSGAQFCAGAKPWVGKPPQDCSRLSLSDIRVIPALLSSAFLLGALKIPLYHQDTCYWHIGIHDIARSLYL